MGWEGWTTLATVAAMIGVLACNLGSTDFVFLCGLTFLVTLGVVSGSGRLPSPEKAITGFGNEGLITVAVLYVVVCGLVQTGALSRFVAPLLGKPRNAVAAQVRVLAPVGLLSAFLNNTPVVAMFMPVISDLCKKTGISPSKLFMPLSMAAILGGVCTLIGTSTNLIVHGLLKSSTGQGLGMWDITWVGVPCTLAGFAFVLLSSRWLLPDRKSALNFSDDPRQYTVEMIVEPASPLAGQTIEAAGLRHLPGLFLVEIDREGHTIGAVSPQERLRSGDRLVFVGIIESVVDLRKVRGLSPATDQVFKLDSLRSERCLVEAVVSDSCPLAGKTIREGRFRTMYNAAVIAVARNGQRLRGKIGDIELRPGDSLLLEAHPSFADQQRNSRDFFLVSRVEGSAPLRHEKAWIALVLLAALIVVAGADWLSMLNVALLAGTLTILTGCCTAREARLSIDWEVLSVIGAALGIGKAMESSGVATAIANLITGSSYSPWVSLALIYATTLILTEVMSNNAAAALIFPIAMAIAAALKVSHMPFIIAVMIAASCGFATPIGYQTNLMVYGPGGYKFSDYLKIGIPLDLVVMVTALGVIPLAWPF